MVLEIVILCSSSYFIEMVFMLTFCERSPSEIILGVYAPNSTLLYISIHNTNS